ncbi:S53 family peptidase [Acidiferrimicrobium sp. IK]|uniref:S53 family peptidase n=1 Tax=Acidiferrimicrobium sp. IK TaxID=2871700 RepID=UPI0021CB60DE|nr:S53 family peptidase [Acidiferrimicrobium sp. IK]MCU4182803.1 S53 family peptidase [Acidiferrimicrobium sp. IK]
MIAKHLGPVLGASMLGALLVPALAGTAAASATGWVATATQALPTAGLTDLGPLAGSTPMTVTVALDLRDRPALDSDIARGTILTSDQFDQQFAPTAGEVSQVEGYLQHAGLNPTSVSANNVLITASGTAGAVEAAFDTAIHSFAGAGHAGYANTAPASVPSTLGGVVGSVLGLDTLTVMVPTTRHAAAANPPSSCAVPGVGYPCTYNPQGLQAAYDATTAPTGAKSSIAIFAEGDLSQVVKDLRQEETANGLPQVPVSIVPTGIASSDTSGADEWDLDTQYSTGMAQTVKRLYIYDATSLTDADTAREFNAFVTQHVAQAASASFGECEYGAYLDGAMLADDETFAQAAVQGQTVFASAGDTGGFCPVAPNNGVPVGVPDVNYPASSPYVASVGGTTLVTNSDGSYNTEAAWVGGGGGVSLFESAPAWQGSDGVTGAVLPTACAVQGCGRTVPDVANDADPNSGANVYVAGTPTAVGGTSLSSPLTLGVWARMESAKGNGLGFASPLLYKANGTAAFHDVTLGDTGPYPATPGYDLATGIGSFDVAQAVKVIG